MGAATGVVTYPTPSDLTGEVKHLHCALVIARGWLLWPNGSDATGGTAGETYPADLAAETPDEMVAEVEGDPDHARSLAGTANAFSATIGTW